MGWWVLWGEMYSLALSAAAALAVRAWLLRHARPMPPASQGGWLLPCRCGAPPARAHLMGLEGTWSTARQAALHVQGRAYCVPHAVLRQGQRAGGQGAVQGPNPKQSLALTCEAQVWLDDKLAACGTHPGGQAMELGHRQRQPKVGDRDLRAGARAGGRCG